MAVPLRLRQQQQLQQRLDTAFKEPVKDPGPELSRTITVESSRPPSPQSSFQSESNFFDTINEVYGGEYNDEEFDEHVSVHSSPHSPGTRELAARLDKLIPRQQTPVAVADASYGALSQAEAERVRALDPLDIASAKRNVVVKNIKGEMNGSVSIVPLSKSLDDSKFVNNDSPKSLQNTPKTPNAQTFANSTTPVISHEKFPPRPDKDPRRSPEFAYVNTPIPPRTMAFIENPVYQARAFSEDNTPRPTYPPVRGSSFDKTLPMSERRPPPQLYQNPLPPQQQQYIPPRQHRPSPSVNPIMQNAAPPARPEPGPPQQSQPRPFQPPQQQANPPVIHQFRRDDNTVQFRPPTMPFQQTAPLPVPTSFRSRNDHPAPAGPSFPLLSPPQQVQSPPLQEKKLFVGQRITPANSPATSPQPGAIQLDSVPSTWPKKNDDTIVRRPSSTTIDEDETLKHTSNDDDEHGADDPGTPGSSERKNRKKHHRHHRRRSSSRSRSRSRDVPESDVANSDVEAGERKKKKKRRRGGVVISRRMRRVWKVVVGVVVANLVIVDALLVVLLVSRRAF